MTTMVTHPSRAPAADRQPLWLYVVVIIGALGVLSLGYSAVFSPATMLTSGQHLSGGTRTWAHYTAPYDIALGAALLVSLAIRAWRVLAGTLLQAAFAEILLAIVGIAAHRWSQVAADVVLTVAFLLCARRLLRTPQGPAAG